MRVESPPTAKLLCNVASNSTSNVSLMFVASSTSSVPLNVVLPLIVVLFVTYKFSCNLVSSSTSNVSLIVVASSTSNVPLNVVLPITVVSPPTLK